MEEKIIDGEIFVKIESPFIEDCIVDQRFSIAWVLKKEVGKLTF